MIELVTFEAQDLVRSLVAELKEIEALHHDKAKTAATFNKKIKSRESRAQVLRGQIDGDIPLDQQLPLVFDGKPEDEDLDDESGEAA